jgi:hypothetical protein
VASAAIANALSRIDGLIMGALVAGASARQIIQIRDDLCGISALPELMALSRLADAERRLRALSRKEDCEQPDAPSAA